VADLTTKYVGLTLKSPIVVASAGITETVERMEKCQENRAGAVVMKSYFEEEISRTSPTPRFKVIRHDMGKDKTFTLFSYEQASEWDIERYAQEVSAAKSKLNIKIIPSINCITDEGWVESARMLEAAGADALELNTSCPHGSITFRGQAVEETIFRTVRLVREAVSLPIIVKISPMVTSPIGLAKGVEEIGVQGVTIFNRMTGLVIDIEEEAPIMHGGYAGHGGPWAIQYPLRWISEIRPQININIAGSGGVSTWQDVVKYILVGANVVQTCTAVIMNGYEIIGELLSGLEDYMDRKGYETLDDFRGKVCTRILGTHEVDRRHKFRAHISYDDHIAPCVSACPAHVPAEAYVRLIAQGKFAEAARVIRSKNPFQSICGYVCYHPCEDECTRGLTDQPIAIRALKRFALEWAEQEGHSPSEDDAATMPASGHKVAIVGAGPAGLTAAHDLTKMGHEVTVFEAMPAAGGMLRMGIPEYRLPRDVLDREIAYIESVGVKIRLDSVLGKDFTLTGLKERGFEAIMVAIGAQRSTRLAIPGGDSEGVISALDFLKKVNITVPPSGHGNPPLTPPLKRNTPLTPPLKRNIPLTPPLKRNIPLTPPLKRNIPLTPPLKRNIPLTPPLKRGMGGFLARWRMLWENGSLL
jgi:dihydroorotate dehydrogenase (fumarate)